MALGKIIEVNLTDFSVCISEYPTDIARRYLGGFGFNTWYLFKHLPAKACALGPENLLLISSGLLTGTAVPSSSRVHISAKSPLSGYMGSSNVGGLLGTKLRSCGISSLILRGRSPRPVYLKIDPNGVKIEGADQFWGLDTRETEKGLKDMLNDKNAEIITIGIAGENQVRYACLMAGEDHSAGRTGMGAVMGSKNLKAIVVQGNPRRDKMDAITTQLVKEYIHKIKANISRYHDYSTWGSSGDVLETNEMGMLGTKNYRQSQFEAAENIDGRRMTDYSKRKTSCHRCPVACKAVVEINSGKYKGFKGGRPEYETSISLGSLCGLKDPEALIYLSNLCNIFGLDTISTGSVIAFAMDLFDRNILNEKDTGGLSLTWGNAEAMETLINQIARREGLGNILADGVKRAAEIIGKGSDQYAYYNKGVEIYGSDPRGMMGLALSYAVSLRGGDFTSIYPVPEFRFTPERAEREFGTSDAVEPTAKKGKGALVRKCMLICAVIDSLGICKVPALTMVSEFDLKMEAAFTRAISRLELDDAELLRIGERIIYLERLFNLKHGATAADDSLPHRFQFEIMPDGPAQGQRVKELDFMVRDFYRNMQWDDEGVPSDNELISIGIKKRSAPKPE